MTRQKELEKLEKLLRDRRGKEHTLKRLSTKCQTLKSNDRLIATIEAKAEQAYSSFKTLHEEILRLCEEEQFDQHFETFDQLSDLYESIKSQCAELSPQSSQQTPTPTPSEQCPPSLYKPLDLPTFNGKEEHWPSFASLFKAKIDSDVRLSGAQKWEYLSCSLRGPVVDLIRHLDFTNEAYEQAWQLLTKRYEHKRRLVLAHASRLLNQAPETDEPGSLQCHIDTSDECLRALKAIRPKVDIENALLIQMVIQKLTLDTIEEWEKSLPDDEIPPFETLLEFLRRRARILESRHRQSYFPQNMPKPKDKPPDGTTSKLTETKLSCPVCKGNHFTTQCHKFSALTVPEKLDLVHKKNLCSNCLSHKHIARQCRAGNCRKCYQRHHTSLHQDLQRPQNLHMTSPSPTSSVLLSTALVEITDNTGKTHTARALVDSGAQSNFISTELFKKLELPKASSSLTFQGLGATQLGQTQGTVQITLSSPIQPDLRLHAEMHIIPHITAQLPTLPVDTTKWSYLNRVELADPTFHIPGKIELLLGAGIYRNILKGGIIEDCAEYPIAQDTKLGWIVMGQLNQSLNESLTHHSLTLDDTMKRFWELENIPSTPHYSPEEIQCEHFQNSVQRLHGGRYQVKLPFHETPNLGESRVQAIVRFKNLERKLQKDCATEMAYSKVIHDYCELGHMEPVPKDELLNSPSAYLPHHGVFEDSTTTKLRVVFDASAKTSNNRSLNDAMLKGPKLQQDIQNLNENKSLHAKSKLHSLAPFLDEMGLLRVGGRIINPSLTPDRKFPILLPKGHHLTEIIIRDMHNEHLHAGPQLLTAIIREQYWVPKLRNIVRKVIHRCTRCFRLKAQGVQQIMGQLPQARVSPSRPFFNCGIDFAGPIKLRTMLARGSKLFKAYIAGFVCFSTKAIHLEAVSSLSTAAFIAALKRFISRRGKPKSMFSDNGTNFVGADRELAQSLKQATADTNDPSVIDYLSTQGIQWHFTPPGAPHLGGLWEAGVKSTKHHLKRVIGETQINFEELSTVLASIEACLNSRPISELSSDPNDLSALTPGHFLIGAPLTSHPEPSLLDVKDSRLSRWQLLQKMPQHFWTRWSQEYLARLQQRPKWSSSGQELKVGQLVLNNLPPLKWKLGRVDHLHPGNDGITRVVTLRTTSGHFKRPVCKICPLPDNDAANGNINQITDQVNPTPTAN